jgi:hypothetical protein
MQKFGFRDSLADAYTGRAEDLSLCRFTAKGVYWVVRWARHCMDAPHVIMWPSKFKVFPTPIGLKCPQLCCSHVGQNFQKPGQEMTVRYLPTCWTSDDGGATCNKPKKPGLPSLELISADDVHVSVPLARLPCRLFKAVNHHALNTHWSGHIMSLDDFSICSLAADPTTQPGTVGPVATRRAVHCKMCGDQ